MALFSSVFSLHPVQYLIKTVEIGGDEFIIVESVPHWNLLSISLGGLIALPPVF